MNRTGFRFVVGGLLFLASMINYVDRSALSIVAPMMRRDLHLDAAQLGIVFSILFTVIPWAAGLVGCILGGLLSDRLLARTGNAVFSRKAVIVATLILEAACLGGLMLIHTTAQAVTPTAGVLLQEGMTPLACWALLQDLVPASRVGSVGGYVHFLSNIAGIIGPALTGFIVQYGGGYGSSFGLAGAVAVAGATAVLLAVRSLPAGRSSHAAAPR